MDYNRKYRGVSIDALISEFNRHLVSTGLHSVLKVERLYFDHTRLKGGEILTSQREGAIVRLSDTHVRVHQSDMLHRETKSIRFHGAFDRVNEQSTCYFEIPAELQLINADKACIENIAIEDLETFSSALKALDLRTVGGSESDGPTLKRLLDMMQQVLDRIDEGCLKIDHGVVL